MPSQYYRPPRQPLLERRHITNNAPVAIMYQPARVPPIEIETQSSTPGGAIAPSMLPSASSSSVSSASSRPLHPALPLLLAKRTPAYRGVLQQTSDQIKACNPHPLTSYHPHRRSDYLAFNEDFEDMGSSSQGDQKGKQLIVKLKISPEKLQAQLQSDFVEKDAEALLDCFRSDSVIQRDRLQALQASTTPFDASTINVERPKVTLQRLLLHASLADNFGQVGHFTPAPFMPAREPHGLPMPRPSRYLVLDSHTNTTRTRSTVATEIRPAITHHFASQIAQNTVKNLLGQRAPLSQLRVAPVQHQAPSAAPKASPAQQLRTPRRTISKESSGSSKSSAASGLTVDSLLSHITVAPPHGSIELDLATRYHSMGNEVSREATLPSHRPFFDTSGSVEDKPKAKRKQKAHQAPGTPPPTKRIRSDSVLPATSKTVVDFYSSDIPFSVMEQRVSGQVEPQSQTSDEDDDMPISTVKRRQIHQAKKHVVSSDESDAVPLSQMKRRVTPRPETRPNGVPTSERSAVASKQRSLSSSEDRIPSKAAQSSTDRSEADASRGTIKMVRRAVDSPQVLRRRSSEAKQIVQEELRSELRTRIRLQEANSVMGSSPVKKNRRGAPTAWITREQLLHVDPRDYTYPIALKDFSKGTWSEIENEEDLREEIEDEQERHKSSPDPKASRRPDKPLQIYASIFSTMSGPAILQHHIDQAATAFKNEMFYVQALSKTVWNAHGSKGDFDLVQDAAEDWLHAFDAGQTAFELACDQLGLSTNAMIEAPVQSFAVSDEYAMHLTERMNSAHEDGTRNMTGAEHMAAMEQEADRVPLKRQNGASDTDGIAPRKHKSSALASPTLESCKTPVLAVGQQPFPPQRALSMQQLNRSKEQPATAHSASGGNGPPTRTARVIDLLSDED